MADIGKAMPEKIHRSVSVMDKEPGSETISLANIQMCESFQLCAFNQSAAGIITTVRSGGNLNPDYLL